MRNHWLALAATTALISSVAFAQVTTPQGIPVLSGGVGSSDRAAIEAQQSSYALKLVYSGQGGAFLSGVNVSLTDKHGATILSTITDGPILLTTPPAGTYKLTSTVNGIVKTQNVTAGTSLKTYQISFPIKDDDDLTSPDGVYLPKAASPLDNGYVPVQGGATYYAPAAPAPAGYVPAPNALPTPVGE